MSYLVIARKWRPSLFEEIVGQSHVIRTLRNAVSSGRIAHAYIFSGPRGVGKTTAARILAKSLNCAKGPTAEPCNTCESCKGIAGGSSVDVFEIDGASNTSVDNVRELRENVRYVPSQGKYKVYIIDEVHMLSGSAFNALLKTLEEPPPHAVFIFATTEVHKIPATILSRCQRLDFKRIPFRELQGHLKKILSEEGIKYDEKAVYTIAREADGSLRDGQSLLEQVLAFGAGELKESDASEALGLMDSSVLYEMVEAVIRKDGRACLNIVEKVYNFGYDLKRALSDLLELIRDLTVIKVTGDPTLLDLPDSDLERLNAIAADAGTERLHMLFAIMSKAYEEVSRSATPRYSFEMALLKAASFEVQPVTELISRLEGLRNKVEAGGHKGLLAADAGVPVKRPAVANEPSAPYGVRQTAPQAVTRVVAEASAEKDEATRPAATVTGAGPEALRDFLGRKINSLGGSLGSAGIRLSSDEVEITVPSSAQAVFRIKQKQLEAACQEFSGRPMKVRITATEGAAEKKTEIDPLVKDAVRIFGGKVIEDRRRTNV